MDMRWQELGAPSTQPCAHSFLMGGGRSIHHAGRHLAHSKSPGRLESGNARNNSMQRARSSPSPPSEAEGEGRGEEAPKLISRRTGITALF